MPVGSAQGLVRPSQVVVHPLVLLSVVDHYRRMALAPGRRVVGVLLGQWNGHVVNVSNCYASTAPPHVPLPPPNPDSSV